MVLQSKRRVEGLSKPPTLRRAQTIERAHNKWEREPSPQQISRQKRKRRAGQRERAAGSRAYLVSGRKENWATERACLCQERGKTKQKDTAGSTFVPQEAAGKTQEGVGYRGACGAERWRVGFGLGKQGTHKEGRGKTWRNCELQIYEERDRRKKREKRIKGRNKNREFVSLFRSLTLAL